MPDYCVYWEINIFAANPREAAEQARALQAPGTSALVFDVYDDEGEHTKVDLEEGYDDAEIQSDG